MAGGILLGVVGTWLLCQILGGNALGRLGIVDTGIAEGGVSGGIVPQTPAGVSGGLTPGPGQPMPRDTGRGD